MEADEEVAVSLSVLSMWCFLCHLQFFGEEVVVPFVAVVEVELSFQQ